MAKQGGAYARTRGHSFERWAVNFFKKLFPEAERCKSGDRLDVNGVDLRGCGQLRIQCKRNKGYASINKIEEVKTGEGIPVLLTKADRKPAVVCLYAEDFIKILTDIGEVYDQSINPDRVSVTREDD